MSGANSNLSVENFVVTNKKLHSSFQHHRSHSCGGFVSNIFSKSFSKTKDQDILKGGFDNTIHIRFTKNQNLNTHLATQKMISWWTEQISEHFGIKSKYLGLEGNFHNIIYVPKEVSGGVQRLARYTILRYIWTHPYNNIPVRMYNLYVSNPELYEEYDFGHIFSFFNTKTSIDCNWGPTFGLVRQTSYMFFSAKEMYRILNDKGGMSGSYGGINNTFTLGSIIRTKDKFSLKPFTTLPGKDKEEMIKELKFFIKKYDKK